jgi:hypothetical protein
MKEKFDIYRDFKGYNAYPLMEAERIIRGRILQEFSKLIQMVEGCEKKAGDMRLIWILEHITVLMRRMQRMKREIEERNEVFVPVYLKARIAHLDEEKLKQIDYKLVELITKSREIIDTMSCAETDTRIIEKFSHINENLRQMETQCQQRALILKKEVF